MSDSNRAPHGTYHRRALTACVLATLVGCGVADRGETPGAPPLDTTTDSAQSLTGPDCTAMALQSPDGCCDGAWRFDWVHRCADPAICGFSTQCHTFNSCVTYDAGILTSNAGEAGLTQHKTTCTDRCTNDDCTTTCTGDDGSACIGEAASRQNQIIASVPPSTPGRTGWIPTLHVSGVYRLLHETVTHSGGQPGKPITTITTDTFVCDKTITNKPSPAFGPGASCGCATFEPNVCVCDSGTTFTAPAPDALAPTSAGTGRDFNGAPVCTTCDVPDIGRAGAAGVAFDCLVANRSGAPAAVDGSIVARLKLLFQLHADGLSADQRTRAESVYDGSIAAVCGAAIPFAPDCQAEAAPLSLPGQLQLCQDLVSNPNVPRAVAVLELPHCLTQLSTVDGLSTDGCRLATRDAADAAARGVLDRAQPDYTADLATALPTAISRIDTWWSAARIAARGDTGWLLEQSSAVTRSLWAGLEEARVPLPGPGLDDAQAAALLADVADVGLDDDVAVVTALFADAQDSTSPVVLTLTGDALRGMSDRLSHLEVIHDVGCRFAACKTTGALRTSAVSELIHALAMLGDPDQLGSALAAASHLQQQQPALHAALGQIRAHYARLTGAWAALGRPEPFRDLAKIADPPPEVASLAEVMRQTTVAWSSYQATGEFAPGHRPRLTAATLEQSAVIADLDQLISDTNSAKTTFASQREATVNDLLAQVQNAETSQSILDRNAELRVQLADVESRSLGLENREMSDRTAQAKFQEAFELVAAALDANAVFHSAIVPAVRASAQDAHFPIDAAAPSLSRDQFHVETLNAGDSLRIHVSGTWSPSCALKKAVLLDPSGNATPLSVPDPALTGPTGYWASLDNGQYTAHTETHDATGRTDIGVSIEACAGTPGADLTGSSWKACAHLNVDQTWSSSTDDANGNQTRVGASFATGIRLPITPFPVAPAGSLVAVVTRTSDPFDPIDIRVVLSDDLIVAPALPPGVTDTIDVHFVVNDAVADCAADGNDSLQLDMVKTTPFGSVAKALAGAMASTLTELEAEAPAILAEGQLAPNEATALRSAAWVSVQHDLPPGLGLADLPPDLHNLFEAFLDREIASLSRRADMHVASLQREQLLLEFAANTDELNFADQKSRLTFLIPRWRLRDLSGVDLAHSTEALTQSLTAYIAPIFELRDPAHYTSFPAQASAQLTSLIDLQITAPLEDQVANLVALSQTLRNALAAAAFELPATAIRTLIIAIPRPPTDEVPDPLLPPWQTVTPATAAAFWKAAFDASGHLSHSVRLTLAPSDLYVFGGNAATLACSDTQSDLAPVVRRAAVYLDTQAFINNSLGIELPAVAAASSDVTFPLFGKTTVLAPDDPRGIPISLPVLAGGASEALDKFNPPGIPDRGLGAGAGLSPFTSFDLDLTGLAMPNAKEAWDGTQAIYLMFEVERRISLDPALVEGVCVDRDPSAGN